jgi:hypothetical protein
MRGQSLTGLLAYEAKRHPHVKELVERVTTLTDEDIERAVVPLPWFRQALRMLRAEERAKSLVVTSMNGFVEDPPGHVAIFNQLETWVPVSARSSVLVASGYPVWFPDAGGVWIDTIFCASIPSVLATLPQGERMTKTEYQALLRDRRARLV